MLEIKDAEKTCAQDIYRKCGLDFYGDSDHCMLAKDGEETVGFALFKIADGCITLLKLSAEEPLVLADALLRSALFYAANHGIMEARFASTVNGAMIKKLGFCDDPKTGRMDITELFHSCGGCK